MTFTLCFSRYSLVAFPAAGSALRFAIPDSTFHFASFNCGPSNGAIFLCCAILLLVPAFTPSAQALVPGICGSLYFKCE